MKKKQSNTKASKVNFPQIPVNCLVLMRHYNAECLWVLCPKLQKNVRCCLSYNNIWAAARIGGMKSEIRTFKVNSIQMSQFERKFRYEIFFSDVWLILAVRKTLHTISTSLRTSFSRSTTLRHSAPCCVSCQHTAPRSTALLKKHEEKNLRAKNKTSWNKIFFQLTTHKLASFFILKLIQGASKVLGLRKN